MVNTFVEDEELRKKLNFVPEIGTIYRTCKGINALDGADNLTASSMEGVFRKEGLKYAGTKGQNKTNEYIAKKHDEVAWGNNFFGHLQKVRLEW